EAELLVGADGLRSTIRQQCLPELAPLYVGYVAWRALIPEAAFAPAIHRELFNYMTFCLPPGEQCLGYPVAGPDNDLRPRHRPYTAVAPGPPRLKRGWVPAGEGARRTAAPPHRCRRHHPHDIDSAAADPARGDRADARRGRAAARAAVSRGGANDRRADPAAD